MVPRWRWSNYHVGSRESRSNGNDSPSVGVAFLPLAAPLPAVPSTQTMSFKVEGKSGETFDFVLFVNVRFADTKPLLRSNAKILHSPAR